MPGTAAPPAPTARTHTPLHTLRPTHLEVLVDDVQEVVGGVAQGRTGQARRLKHAERLIGDAHVDHVAKGLRARAGSRQVGGNDKEQHRVETGRW